jgi:predicted dienelactone hydrolase
MTKMWVTALITSRRLNTEASMPIGFTEGLSFDAERQNWRGDGPRPLNWAVWYPAAASAVEKKSSATTWFDEGPIARDAALEPSENPYPLVLLSHGTGGVAAGLEWLGRRLAQRGFVALAVNHHGNTGVEPYAAEGFLCLWERARDLSMLLEDENWRERLGGSVNAYAGIAGFSAGAYAAMLLMGARVEYSQFEPDNPVKSPVSGPMEFPDLADRIPTLLEKNAIFRESWDRRRDSYADSRFTAALALAPGRSVLGFEIQSLTRISKPVRIYVGGADALAPAEECSHWLRSNVPGSELEILPKAGHYVFLTKPSAHGLKEGQNIFSEAQSVDRAVVHERVALSASRLFDPN